MTLKNRKLQAAPVLRRYTPIRIFSLACVCIVTCLLPAVSLFAQQQRSLRHYALVLEDPAVGERFTTRAETRSAAAEDYRRQIRSR